MAKKAPKRLTKTRTKTPSMFIPILIDDDGESSREAESTKRTFYTAIDAAAKILRAKRNNAAMTTNELVEEAAARGYWKGSGATPAQSLYGAIHRDIKKNGSKSRFRKIGKNSFAFNHPAA